MWRPGQVSIFWPTISNHVWWPRNGMPGPNEPRRAPFFEHMCEHTPRRFSTIFQASRVPTGKALSATSDGHNHSVQETHVSAFQDKTSVRISTTADRSSFNVVTSSRPPHCWTSRSNLGLAVPRHPVPRAWICAPGDWRLLIQIFVRCLAESTKYCNVPAVTRTGIQSQCLSARRKRNLSRSLDVLFTVTGIAESTNVARFLKNPVWSSFT